MVRDHSEKHVNSEALVSDMFQLYMTKNPLNSNLVW